jgi:hypothetical protein
MNTASVACFSVLGVLLIGLCGGCALRGPSPVVAAEQKMVAHCAFIDTIAVISDMGAFQVHPKYADKGRDEALRIAERLNATHVVWLAGHSSGAAALAYRCGD